MNLVKRAAQQAGAGLSIADLDRSVYGYVYCIQNIRNGKRYIGQTTRTVARRWTEHASESKTPHGIILKAAIRKYGRAAFVVTELAAAASSNQLNGLERQFIDLFRSTDPRQGYNSKDGGIRGRGYKHTVAAREKIARAAAVHPVAPNVRRKISETSKGRVPSARTRALISVSGKGRKHTNEARAKIGAAGCGRIVSDETRAKISAAHKQSGHKPSQEASRAGNLASRYARRNERTP